MLRSVAPGFILDGGAQGDILLPGSLVPPGAVVGGVVDVFVYRDSEDRLVATTEAPLAVVGEFALLRVLSFNARLGAFLDWGLSKDLLLPLREQAHPIRPGDWILVRVALDEKSDRVVASMRLNRYLNLTPPTYVEGERVGLTIIDRTELGYNAIVEGAHRGLLYHSDLAAPLSPGQKMAGYIRAVRPDGKLDLALDRAGYRRIAPLTEQIVAALQISGGRLAYNDESSPEAIREAFGVSKKAFKQAIGSLYKQRVISIENHGIRLVGKLDQTLPAAAAPRIAKR